METKIMYDIYELNSGLLQRPKNGYGDNIFSQYGYDTFEDAIKALKESEEWGNHIILTVANNTPEY